MRIHLFEHAKLELRPSPGKLRHGLENPEGRAA